MMADRLAKFIFGQVLILRTPEKKPWPLTSTINWCFFIGPVFSNHGTCSNNQDLKFISGKQFSRNNFFFKDLELYFSYANRDPLLMHI